jgi:hypothetical protein
VLMDHDPQGSATLDTKRRPSSRRSIWSAPTSATAAPRAPSSCASRKARPT